VRNLLQNTFIALYNCFLIGKFCIPLHFSPFGIIITIFGLYNWLGYSRRNGDTIHCKNEYALSNKKKNEAILLIKFNKLELSNN